MDEPLREPVAVLSPDSGSFPCNDVLSGLGILLILGAIILLNRKSGRSAKSESATCLSHDNRDTFLGGSCVKSKQRIFCSGSTKNPQAMPAG